MPRTADIKTAIHEATQLKLKGYRYLSTDSFIAKLREFNRHFSHDDAISWIERYPA